MLTKSEPKQAAQAMLQTEREAKRVVQLTTTYLKITTEDAYAVQSEVIATKLAAGTRAVGLRIGLTFKTTRAASRVNEPDYRVPLDDMSHLECCSNRGTARSRIRLRAR